jgi:hypothetical protein
MRNLCRIAIVALLLVVATAATASACPGCKEATSEQQANLARGFSYSILFMMPIPFLIVGSFGGYVYYVVRKREQEQAAASSTTVTSESSAPNEAVR